MQAFVCLPRKLIAAAAAVTLVVCVALVSHTSETSFKSKVPTLSLTRVARWTELAEAPDAVHQDGQQKITMLQADFPVFSMLQADFTVFSMLAGERGMNCSEPATCACSALLMPDGNVVCIRVAQVPEKDRFSGP
jgi:hypothetical protein